jgi:hypothetical protein
VRDPMCQEVLSLSTYRNRVSPEPGFGQMKKYNAPSRVLAPHGPMCMLIKGAEEGRGSANLLRANSPLGVGVLQLGESKLKLEK